MTIVRTAWFELLLVAALALAVAGALNLIKAHDRRTRVESDVRIAMKVKQ